MIKVESLAYAYSSNKVIHFPDFEVAEKENLMIYGASGVGKSTLLSILATHRKYTSGSYAYLGKEVNQFSLAELTKFRKEDIGMVFQRPKFISYLTLFENIDIVRRQDSITHFSNSEFLQILDLEAEQKKYPHQLSEGQKQRLQIAIALAKRPKLVLADEPTSSLDDENTERSIQLLLKLCAETSASLLVVSHDRRIQPYFSNTLPISTADVAINH